MTLAEAARRFKSTAGGHSPPTLVLITDSVRLPDPLPAIARLPAGSAVILRHYDIQGRARLARRIGYLVRRRRLLLLVAGDWRLAAAIGADGVHLPEFMARHDVLAPLLGWRRRQGALLTVACHSPAALARARALKADAALLSPVFPTPSHPHAPGLGPLRFALWRQRAGLPVLALGGVTARSIRRLPAADGVAAIGGWVG